MSFYLERRDLVGVPAVRLSDGATSIGRGHDNNIVLPAADRCVSGYHALIYAAGERLLLQDLQSTNGTFVNGTRISERSVKIGDEIRFGRSGPIFSVASGDDAIVPDVADEGVLLDDRRLSAAPKPSQKKPMPPIVVLSLITIAVSVALVISMSFIFKDGSSSIEASETSPSPQKFFSQEISDSLRGKHGSSSNDLLDNDDISSKDPSRQARSTNGRESVEARIDAILRRFGETDYRAPAEMVERVDHYLVRYSGAMKSTISEYMARRKKYFPMIRRVFTERNIPLDLAYVSILESGLDPHATSHAGAKGLWQFMPKTAKSYGLEVSAKKDERTDPEKSTYAAAAYFKDLIAVFGSKSSVMLCMAAYNAGEHRVMNALRKIDDPVSNRDFWYLYKMGWLAEETNEYIPQVIALIIISENPRDYGFDI